jgi:hypothetical protein
MPGGRPIPLWAWLAGGLGAAFILGVLVVSFSSMRKKADFEMCSGNLRILYMSVRSGDLLDAPGWDRAATGRAFFAYPERWPGRQKRSMDLHCPVKGTRDDIDYRGPATSLRQMKDGDPIIADRPGNHGPGAGGNVVLLRGEIYACPEEHPLWLRAAATTAD